MVKAEAAKTITPTTHGIAMEIILRAVLATLSPEPLAKTRKIARGSVEFMHHDPTLFPSGPKAAEEVGAVVNFIFNHMTEEA
ncbi:MULTISPECIES: hypothetical protein [Serratia]|uniref:Uncharacterized protein n=1 Tax=Serratia quinivorans TaxID=137545 RepID=A0A379YEM8_9GAMM|nr:MULTISPECIES: hypothetical protein [Serratia]RYM66279.1 hypothetical protein BSR03_01535 [Serratia proteamaculans]CAI1830077.1 Uncharacterised protein [Serratia quinivorans]SUI44189.1 Uncharacterised protein [Serratia quinivorans]